MDSPHRQGIFQQYYNVSAIKAEELLTQHLDLTLGVWGLLLRSGCALTLHFQNLSWNWGNVLEDRSIMYFSFIWLKWHVHLSVCNVRLSVTSGCLYRDSVPVGLSSGSLWVRCLSWWTRDIESWGTVDWGCMAHCTCMIIQDFSLKVVL